MYRTDTTLPEPASGHLNAVFGRLNAVFGRLNAVFGHMHAVFGRFKKGTDATVRGFYIM